MSPSRVVHGPCPCQCAHALTPQPCYLSGRTDPHAGATWTLGKQAGYSNPEVDHEYRDRRIDT
jgi:hypothetical protein